MIFRPSTVTLPPIRGEPQVTATNDIQVLERNMFAAKACALFRVIVPLACLLSSPACAASWTASIDQRNGLPSILKGGGAAVSSDFVFWGKNWAWANFAKEFKVIAPYNYSIVGQDQMLNFALNGRVTKASNQQLLWEFDLNASGRNV